MNIFERIGAYFCIALLLASGGYILYLRHQLNVSANEVVVAQKQLSDNILRSSNKVVSQDDVEKFAKEHGMKLKPIEEDANKEGGTITAANSITIISHPQKGSNISSTKVGESAPTRITKDKYGCLERQQILELKENFSGQSVPIGSVSFEGWKEKPWTENILGRKYSISNVLAKKPDGSLLVYNTFILTVDGKNYTIKIDNAKTVETVPSAKFSWFNPRAFITGGAVFALNDGAKPSFDIGAGVSIFSYGKFTRSPEWTFLGIGGSAAISNNGSKPVIFVNPVSYNFGRAIPGDFMSNSYISPTVQFDPVRQTVFGGLNLTIGL